MPELPSIPLVILLILVVVAVFNVIIFVHELGHFWAAKWRGLQIDRFQIWFGKPIWKKEINGVQYGLGWIPAGGFVALPQMAPMEAIEGGEKPEKPLPPITPLDKIIVAFAGPAFSMMLALLSAVIVWQVGKPKDFVPSQEIGYLLPGSPAEKAGFHLGDKILEINGEPVSGFDGSLDSITTRIVLSRGNEINFTVARPGEANPIHLKSGFETEKSKWWQRRGLRKVGLAPSGPAIVGDVVKNSPAAKAGIAKGDQVTSIDGNKLFSLEQFSQYLKDQNWKTVHLAVLTAAGVSREVDLTPVQPLKPEGSDPRVGILWDTRGDVDTRMVYPEPLQQVRDSLNMMWITLSSVKAQDSNVGVDHLSGPVGIAKMLYALLQLEPHSRIHGAFQRESGRAEHAALPGTRWRPHHAGHPRKNLWTSRADEAPGSPPDHLRPPADLPDALCHQQGPFRPRRPWFQIQESGRNGLPGELIGKIIVFRIARAAACP